MPKGLPKSLAPYNERTLLEPQPTVRRPNPRYLKVLAHNQFAPKKAGLKKVEELSRAGHDILTIAKALGIGKTTFVMLRKRFPEVQQALDDGRAELGNELNDLLLAQARQGNTTAMIFLAKGRLHWRDVGPANPEAQGPTVNINITAPMSDDDFRKMVDITPKAEDSDDE